MMEAARGQRTAFDGARPIEAGGGKGIRQAFSRRRAVTSVRRVGTEAIVRPAPERRRDRRERETARPSRERAQECERGQTYRVSGLVQLRLTPWW